MALKNSFVVLEETEDNTSVLLIAKVILLFTLKEEAEHSEEEYASLQYIGCTSPLVGIVKEVGSVCLRWSATNDIDHNNG